MSASERLRSGQTRYVPGTIEPAIHHATRCEAGQGSRCRPIGTCRTARIACSFRRMKSTLHLCSLFVAALSCIHCGAVPHSLSQGARQRLICKRAAWIKLPHRRLCVSAPRQRSVARRMTARPGPPWLRSLFRPPRGLLFLPRSKVRHLLVRVSGRVLPGPSELRTCHRSMGRPLALTSLSSLTEADSGASRLERTSVHTTTSPRGPFHGSGAPTPVYICTRAQATV